MTLRLQVILATAFLTVSFLSMAHGFTAGAPPLKTVCRDMVPQHHEYKPQPTASPYLISVDKTAADGGTVLRIRINSTDALGTKVRGFYIQARDSETNMPIGTFSTSNNVGTHSCNGKRMNAATHTNGNILKDYVDVEWTAPFDYEGEVLILGTVLRDFVTFWSGNYAEPVSITKKASN